MIFDLKKLSPGTKPEPPADLIGRWAAHYRGVLKKYGYDDRCPDAFAAIAEYLARFCAGYSDVNRTAEYRQVQKGLFLYGPTGTGKTSALRIFSGLFKIDIVNAHDLASVYAADGEGGFWEFVRPYRYKHLIIDDLGAERKTKSFGNAPALPMYLAYRDEIYAIERKLTFFTSNVKNREELTEIYGARVRSRILGMCDMVLVNGEDSREAANG